MKKFILIVLGVFAIVFTSAGITLMSMNKSLPNGQTGEKAEQLTKKIEQAVNMSAWKNTAAVEFLFDYAKNRHFVDMKRGLVEVEWTEKSKYKVQYYKKDRSICKVWKDDKIMDSNLSSDLVEKANKAHVNDFFWLNPYAALRAPGTIRKYVGEQALLLIFESGGVTPGDSYLFITDENHRPVRIQMWVSVFPIKGIEWNLESWIKSSTGAMLNNKNSGGMLTIEIKDIKTWAQYPAKKEDRFASLLPLLKKGR